MKFGFFGEISISVKSERSLHQFSPRYLSFGGNLIFFICPSNEKFSKVSTSESSGKVRRSILLFLNEC